MSGNASVRTFTGKNKAALPASAAAFELIFAHASYVASATVGNRQLALQLLAADGIVLGQWSIAPVMTATVTYQNDFFPGAGRPAAYDGNNYAQTPTPAGMQVPPGCILQLIDVAGIDAAGDTITATFEVAAPVLQ